MQSFAPPEKREWPPLSTAKVTKKEQEEQRNERHKVPAVEGGSLSLGSAHILLVMQRRWDDSLNQFSVEMHQHVSGGELVHPHGNAALNSNKNQKQNQKPMQQDNEQKLTTADGGVSAACVGISD